MAKTKKTIKLMFEGNRSRNRLHYDNWEHPIPVDGSYVYATGPKTIIRGRVSDIRWSVFGETDPLGDVSITVFVDDIASDNNGLGPDGNQKNG